MRILKTKKIISNKIQCKFCKDIIVSKHTHDYVTCSCGRVSVDGGDSYLKRSFKEFDDYIELSEIETIEIPDLKPKM